MKGRREDGCALCGNSLSNKLKAENVCSGFYFSIINQLECDRINSIRAQKAAI